MIYLIVGLAFFGGAGFIASSVAKNPNDTSAWVCLFVVFGCALYDLLLAISDK